MGHLKLTETNVRRTFVSVFSYMRPGTNEQPSVASTVLVSAISKSCEPARSPSFKKTDLQTRDVGYPTILLCFRVREHLQ